MNIESILLVPGLDHGAPGAAAHGRRIDRRGRTALALLVVALAAGAWPGQARRASAADYYVDNMSAACSNSGPGTPAAPYCTISAALAAHHAAGTTLHVMPGVYREQVSVPASGTSGSPIVLKTESATGNPVAVVGTEDFSDPVRWTPHNGDVWLAPGVNWNPNQVFADGVRLTPGSGSPDTLSPGRFLFVTGAGLYVNAGGGNPAAHGAEVGVRSYGFYVSSRSWVTIDGFKVSRCDDKGIMVTGATSNIEVLHNAVSFCNRYGIQVAGGSSTHIGWNTVTDNGDHGIALTAGTNGATVEHNESARNVYRFARQANGLFLYGANGNLIQRNRFHDNQDTGENFQPGANNNLSLENLSWNNGDHGFDDLQATGNVHIGDVAYNNYKDGFAVDGSATGTMLSNCIAISNGLTTLRYNLWVDSTSAPGFVSNDNIFWNPTAQPPIKYLTPAYSTIAAYSAVSGQDTRSLQSDPMFVDPADGDFHLMPGSPAIDNANSGLPGWPSQDADSRPRIDDPSTPNRGIGPASFADRGALEFVPAGTPPAPSVPPADRVIVVIMANRGYDQVRSAPYTANLIASSTSFSLSYALAHPSQPDHLALWAASAEGVTNDFCPPAGAPFSGENLGHACEAAGLTWKAYCEDLPTQGSTVCTAAPTPAGPLYTRTHAPWTNYANVNHACEVPYGQLATDIANGTLPKLAFVIPNNHNNTANAGCTVADGDAWLANNLPAMKSALGPGGLLILTWNQDDGTAGNHVLTVLAGPLSRSNYVSNRFITPFSIVRTICDALQLTPFNGAVDAAPITDVWRPPQTAAVETSTVADAALGPATPNPFRSSMSSTLRLPGQRHVEATIYDLAGRRVKALFAGAASGALSLRWDGTGADGRAVPLGLYLLRVRAGTATFARKVVRIN